MNVDISLFLSDCLSDHEFNPLYLSLSVGPSVSLDLSVSGLSLCICLCVYVSVRPSVSLCLLKGRDTREPAVVQPITFKPQ